MVIRIEVTSCNGAPPTTPMAAEFDELGGSIGRAEESSLVLLDPERFISRTHASIEFRSGKYVLVDKGKALPVVVNQRPLGNGQESLIGDGDEVVIGSYRMRVAVVDHAAAAAAPPEAFGAPLAGGPAKDDPLALFGAAPVSAPPAPNRPAPARPATPSLMDDPFALPNRGEAGGREAANPLFGASTSDSSPLARLPDDVDFGLGLPSANRSVDEFFGLSTGGNAEPFPPGSPLAGGSGQAGGSQNVDPLVAFGGATPVLAAAPQRNDTPELQASFKVPQARLDPALAKREMPPEVQAAASKPILPPDQPIRGAAGAASVDPLALFGGGESSADVLGVQAPPARPVSAAPPSALLDAFLRGAGMPELQLPGGLTPETMNMLGCILREATQGTLDLLLARATIKREVRADMTMIVGRENNPLKFSPDVETALTHLLTPPKRGFLPPREAMKDAYDDLRSHQFGFMAGMRAALAAVLQRFDPATLEGRLTQKSVMDSVLPMNRRAKLWDLFETLYRDISKEAEDDFHTLFGREFVRAYQAQVERLNRADGNGDR
jgi:FHA domain-containing protein